jgi:hypothetical protein
MYVQTLPSLFSIFWAGDDAPRVWGSFRFLTRARTRMLTKGVEGILTGPPHPSNEGYAYAKRMAEVGVCMCNVYVNVCLLCVHIIYI